MNLTRPGRVFRPSPTHLKQAALAFAVALAAGMPPAPARAFQVPTQIDDLKVTLDTTLKYSAGHRLKDPSATLGGSLNQDDGDRNFRKGLFSNRASYLTEMDVVFRNFGVRASAAGWYDRVYDQANDNASPATVNHLSRPFNEFTDPVRRLHGNKHELLDAFVFGNFDLDGRRASVRAGRHTVLWGESLFFGANGIAAGQAPVDIQKAQSVPNTPFKELMRPVGQVSGSLQLTRDVSFGAYYQYEWDRSRLPGAGSYFASTDTIGDGSERLLAGAPLPSGFRPAFFRGADMSPKDSGQGGVQVKFRLPAGETDYGAYFIRYHEKTPRVYLRPSGGAPSAANGSIGAYTLVYPQNIESLGVSASRTLGEINFSIEASMRRNMPLISATQTVPPVPGFLADNDGNPLYAVGRSAHAQLSWLWTVAPTALFNEASFVGEVAWNRRLSIQKRAVALDPNTTRDAWGLRFAFTPTYRQVLPGLDLSVPLGVGYNPRGRSSVVSVFNNNGVDKGGDVSIGVAGAYLDEWRFGLTYTHFFGKEGTFLDASNFLSFKQYFKDRNYIGFTIQNTF